MEDKNNKDDYYQRQNYEFLVKHGLETQVMKELKKSFKVREVLVIEPKEEEEYEEEDKS